LTEIFWTYVDFQKLYFEGRGPRLWPFCNNGPEHSVMILRATALVRNLIRSSSVIRYVVNDANMSS
jgi:hypothetical protein